MDSPGLIRRNLRVFESPHNDLNLSSRTADLIDLLSANLQYRGIASKRLGQQTAGLGGTV